MNDESTRLLAELVRWTKVTSYKQVKATLEEALAREDDRIIYHLSDGKKTGVEISQATAINPATVSTVQGALAKLGLLAKPVSAKAYEKQFLLEDFGMRLPDVEGAKNARLRKKQGASQEKAPK